MNRFVAFTGIALCGFCTGASADVIFHNGGPNGVVEWLSDADGNVFVDYAEQADDFSLAEGFHTIADIHWWGVYATANTAGTDDFTVRIFEDDGGAPGTTPFFELAAGEVDRTVFGVSNIGLTVYRYDLLIDPLVLTPNTTYWLSILNNTSSDINDDWYWSEALDLGNNWTRTEDGGAWSQEINAELAFYLTGSSAVVPEPASVGLLGLGLLGLIARKRSRS